MRTDVRSRPDIGGIAAALSARLAAAALCVAVAVIHLKDQGGLPGDKQPGYVGLGYYLLELAAVAAVVLLFSRSYRQGWLLALGVAAGPLIGYILSRGPGMPSYTDDRGNWSETIGVLSLIVEGALLILALAAFLRRRDLAAN